MATFLINCNEFIENSVVENGVYQLIRPKI